MLLLGTLVLPLAATAGAAYYGGTQLKDQTLADASQWKGKIDVSQLKDLKGLIDQVENVGIDVSWRDDLLRTLGVSDGSSGDSAPGSNNGNEGPGTDSDGDGGNDGYGNGGDDGEKYLAAANLIVPDKLVLDGNDLSLRDFVNEMMAFDDAYVGILPSNRCGHQSGMTSGA